MFKTNNAWDITNFNWLAKMWTEKIFKSEMFKKRRKDKYGEYTLPTLNEILKGIIKAE